MRILVAEDEGLIAMEMEITLTDEGHEVVGPFLTVKEILAWLDKDEHVDAAILDVALLDGDVFPAASRLRERGVRIIFQSGHIDESGIAKRFPHARICGKPCEMQQLLSVLMNSPQETLSTSGS